MIAPRTLTQMMAESRLEQTRAAIVATLKGLMLGVAIREHPGKLDVADVVARDLVAAPGIMLGWTRVRASRELGGTFGAPVEWAAYIVTEDRADVAANRRIERDAVAHGIGSFLLKILHDPDAGVWGLAGITHPLPEPAPELRPIFTARSAEKGTAFYAVTWTQVLSDEGAPAFGGWEPLLTGDGAEIDATFPPESNLGEDLPAELRAMMREAGEP